MEDTRRTKFQGVHVAMNSCYDSKGRINPEAARKLTRFLADRGVNGIYVGGGTGEGILQTVAERKLMLEAVAAEAKGQLTIMAHIGAATTADSIVLAEHAAHIGVDAISAIPPFFFAYSEEAVRNHWLSIMNSTDLPFIIYHIPSSSGFNMSFGLFEQLLEHENMFGIKVTVPSTFDLQQFKAIGGRDFIVFNGPDQQFLSGRIMGADAGIGGTYGIMPELFLEIDRFFREGNIQQAQKWQFIVNDIIKAMQTIGLFGAIKSLIRMRGIDCGAPRLPLPAVSAEDQPAVEKLFNKIMEAIKDAKGVSI